MFCFMEAHKTVVMSPVGILSYLMSSHPRRTVNSSDNTVGIQSLMLIRHGNS